MAVACHAGSSPKSSAAVNGAADEEDGDRRVERERERERRIGFGEHHDQRTVQRRRDGRGREAAGGGEDEALGHELAHQAAAAGPEREPQRHLRPPRGAAREQQVREVRARDQQQDADARQQRRQRRGQLRALGRGAARRVR